MGFWYGWLLMMTSSFQSKKSHQYSDKLHRTTTTYLSEFNDKTENTAEQVRRTSKKYKPDGVNPFNALLELRTTLLTAVGISWLKCLFGRHRRKTLTFCARLLDSDFLFSVVIRSKMKKPMGLKHQLCDRGSKLLQIPWPDDKLDSTIQTNDKGDITLSKKSHLVRSGDGLVRRPWVQLEKSR